MVFLGRMAPVANTRDGREQWFCFRQKQLDALHDLAAAERARVDSSERSLDRSSHLHLRALIFRLVNENME